MFLVEDFRAGRGVVGRLTQARLPRRAVLFSSAGAIGLLAFAAPALAEPNYCTVADNVTVITCDTGSVEVRATTGETSLTIEGLTMDGEDNINFTTGVGATGPLSMDLTVNDTSVDTATYGGVNVYSSVADTKIDVELGEDVSLTATDIGAGGVWVRNELGGDIDVITGATVTASGADMDGVTATSNSGGVTINNSGNVTATVHRGIYADGGRYNGATGGSVLVSVTNSGEVTGYEDGIRVINNFGIAELKNSGTVESTTKRALVAWTPDGEVVIDNLSGGSATSLAESAIMGMTDAGNITITNDGIANGVIGISAIAGSDEDFTGSGTVTVTNAADGSITSTGGQGIHAWSAQGDVLVTNAGTIDAVGTGIEADTLDGKVTIVNSGSITAIAGIRTGAAATTITNSGVIDAADGTAISMGSGDVTLILQAGSDITGIVSDRDTLSGTNSLVLGGEDDASFDASTIGADSQFRDFSSFIKDGTSIWTLTGEGTTGWTIEDGTLTATDGAAFGVDQAYVVNGGTLDLAGTSASIASLTGTTDGTVNIGNSGSLTLNQNSDVSYAGHLTGGGELTKAGSGTLTLTGDNSSFTGNLFLTGGETIIDGETTAANFVFVGSVDEPSLTVQNSGVLNAASVVVGNSTNNYFSGMEDESGSLTVTGSGSVLNAEFLTIGYYGDGSLTIADGGNVIGSAAISVGAGAVAGQLGTITISGENSRLEGGALYFGASGNGVLNLSDGATMETTAGAFGVSAGTKGSGTISGQGTRWDISQSSLTLGNAGEGTLSVTDGAVVTAAIGDVKLGTAAGGEGNLTVSGAGSSVTAAGDFIIGSYGSGNVSVENNAQIGGAKLIVGFSDGSDGVLDISGAGTLAKGDSYVMIGTYAGSSGTITLSDAATLKADGNRGITLAYEAGSTGTLNIGAAAGDAAAAAGVLDAVNGIQFGGGSGKLVLNHTENDYDLTAGLSGNGVVEVLSGTTIFSGDSSLFSGNLSIKAGTAVLAGTTSAVNTMIDTGGKLQIGNGGTSGSLNGDIVNDGVLAFDRSDALHHNRVIAGSGDLIISGGVITLSGMNTFTGATSIEAGATLALLSQGRVNQSSGVAVHGTFDVTAASSAQINDISGDGTIILGSAGMIVNNASQTFSGQITGIGGMSVEAGVMTLTGASNFENGLGIAQGATVNIGAGGTSGSITADVTNFGSLVFHRSDDVSYAGNISGRGSVTKTGLNTLSFEGSISGVDLKVEEGTARLLGGISSDAWVGEQARLIFARPTSTSYRGALSGTGTVVKEAESSTPSPAIAAALRVMCGSRPARSC